MLIGFDKTRNLGPHLVSGRREFEPTIRCLGTYPQAARDTVLLRKSNCYFYLIIDDLFDGNSYEASIGEHDSEGWFVLVEFVLGNIRVMDQILNTKLLTISP
jgi:hypothetical protein